MWADNHSPINDLSADWSENGYQFSYSGSQFCNEYVSDTSDLFMCVVYVCASCSFMYKKKAKIRKMDPTNKWPVNCCSMGDGLSGDMTCWHRVGTI